MRTAPFGLIFSAFLLLVLPSAAQKNSTAWTQQKQFGIYTEIPGASRVGAEQCATCHSDQSRDYQHAFHSQQGVQCEDCHGYGSKHVEGGGDVSKIISFTKRPPSSANGVCLSCHARDAKVRYWTAGSHSANRVRCIDCHQVHPAAVRAAGEGHLRFDTATSGAFAAESVVPEANVVLRPLAQTNEACVRCHQTEKAQLSLPYHHPLREGKMSCVDCHDPHGGPAGNNLRTSSVNQLCLSCHAQYRGPFAYQHPPVTENCLTCHTSHGSPNTNLLSVSMPALCLQCHASHHNGASLPLDDRCTNCHGSIHGTDVATPSGGSRFIDKGPYG
ncbi:MAG TPA: DmsE family decaheme c-type cytochrome, partial [Terriglobales bacterium]|nr:DmsE family decaheme c-type cytochrome [Terriglobales bacterium]